MPSRTFGATPAEELTRLRNERSRTFRAMDRLLLDKYGQGSAREDSALDAQIASKQEELAQMDAQIREAEVAYLVFSHQRVHQLQDFEPSEPAPVLSNNPSSELDRKRAKAEAIAFVGRAAIHLGKLAQGRDIEAWPAVNMARALDAIEDGLFQDAMAHVEIAISPPTANEDAELRKRHPRTPTRWELASRLVLLGTRVED